MSWHFNIFTSFWASWSCHLLGVADDIAGTFGDASFGWDSGGSMVSGGMEVQEKEMLGVFLIEIDKFLQLAEEKGLGL